MGLAWAQSTPAPPVQGGVSAALATYRAQALRRVSYALHFTLPGTTAQPVAAT